MTTLYSSIKNKEKQYGTIFLCALIVNLVSFMNNESFGQTDRTLRVVFDNISIRNDHDPGFIHIPFDGNMEFSGEWKIVAYINDKLIDLSAGTALNDAYTGKTYSLGSKSVEVTVPEVGGSVKILVYGIDEDGESIGLEPVNVDDCRFPSPNEEEIDWSCLLRNAWNGIAGLTALDKNDPLGTVNKQYGTNDNLGIGYHEELSSKTENDAESEGDYILRYSIEEAGTSRPISGNSLTAEVFVHAGFGEPRSNINHDILNLGVDPGITFHDSLTNVRVIQGPDYVAGDVVEICEHVDYQGRCIKLGPGNYDIGSAPYFFNDIASSIRFIHEGA